MTDNNQNEQSADVSVLVKHITKNVYRKNTIPNQNYRDEAFATKIIRKLLADHPRILQKLEDQYSTSNLHFTHLASCLKPTVSNVVLAAHHLKSGYISLKTLVYDFDNSTLHKYIQEIGNYEQAPNGYAVFITIPAISPILVIHNLYHNGSVVFTFDDLGPKGTIMFHDKTIQLLDVFKNRVFSQLLNKDWEDR